MSDDLAAVEHEVPRDIPFGYHLIRGDIDRPVGDWPAELPEGVEFVSMNPEAFWDDYRRDRRWRGDVRPEAMGAADFLVWCDNARIEELEAFGRKDPRRMLPPP